MRYRLTVLMLLMLLIVLPMMYLPAAPAPEPTYAILDIGPPPKGKTAEEYCKEEIGLIKNPSGMLWHVCLYGEVQKLPSVARLKDAPSWLAISLRFKEENGCRRVRLTIPGVGRAEQVTILNTLLRVELYWKGEQINLQEECLHLYEMMLQTDIEVAKREKGNDDGRCLKAINDLRFIQIPKSRSEIARLKQYAVIKWAR